MSSEPGFPPFADVRDVLARHRAGIDPSELHGLIAGFIAAAGELAGNNWPELLHVEIPRDAIGSGEVLDDLRLASIAGLADPQFGFELLLPDDDEPLLARADALFAWCRGFLAGFVLAPEAAALSEDAEEAFQDLAGIAAFVLDEDDQDEQALAEIVEFARVAALLIHADRARADRPSGRLH